MTPILVIGATGTVGSHVVRELLGRGLSVRAFVRDRARAAAVLDAAVLDAAVIDDRVELAYGDLVDPASIRTALDGVERAFLCTPNHPRQAERETYVIDAAAGAGIGRLVKIGADGTQVGSPVAFWDAHGRIETHLRESGLPAVVLHPSSYTSNLLAAADTIKHTGRLFAPAGDAEVTLVDPRDVAAVAAVVLTEDGHEGRTYTLTGPDAVTYHQAAQQLSAVIGRPVEYVDVPDPAAREGMIRAGLPDWMADQLVILWGQLRRGAAATPTDVVRVLTGREPRTVAEFVRDHAGAFQP
jgi:uncharacterized protein YbjT (DUF2867 family)